MQAFILKGKNTYLIIKPSAFSGVKAFILKGENTYIHVAAIAARGVQAFILKGKNTMFISSLIPIWWCASLYFER